MVERVRGRATETDGDADQSTITGRLRRIAWRVQQCTVHVAGYHDEEYKCANELLDLVALLEEIGRVGGDVSEKPIPEEPEDELPYVRMTRPELKEITKAFCSDLEDAVLRSDLNALSLITSRLCYIAGVLYERRGD